MSPAYPHILRRIAVPAALALTGAYLLIGCIPLPGDYRAVGGGPRPETKIGGPNTSKKPLQVGRSTRQEVHAMLGLPEYATPDGRAVAYMYTIRTGALFWPL